MFIKKNNISKTKNNNRRTRERSMKLSGEIQVVERGGIGELARDQ